MEFQTEGQIAYKIYLRTPHWHRMRDARLELDEFACVDCGKCYDLQVHHITYERMGEEDLADLVTVCDDCHKRRHWVGKINIIDWSRIKVEVLKYREGVNYSREELELLAEKILIEDPLPISSAPQILLEGHLRDRRRKEINASEGVVDPAIVSGLYNRTHPQGRGWTYPDERVDTGLGFYYASIQAMNARRLAEGREWSRWQTDLPRETASIPTYRHNEPQVWVIIREALRWVGSLEVPPELEHIKYTVRCNGKPIDIEFHLRDLWPALMRRAPRQREATFLNVIMDMKQKDVAEIMGIATVSVGQYVQWVCESIATEILTPTIVRSGALAQKTKGRGSHGYRRDSITVEGINNMSYEERCRKAAEMRIKGYTLKAISETLGWASTSGCHYAIKKMERQAIF